MTRRVKGLLIGLAVAAVLVGFAATRLTPRYEKASRAQIEAVLPAELLKFQRATPSQEQEYKRLVEAMNNVDLNVKDSDIPAIAANLVDDQAPAFRRLRVFVSHDAALGKQAGPESITAEYSKQRGIIKVLCAAAQHEAEQGNGQKAVEHIRLAADLLQRMRSAESSVIAYLVDIACESIVHAAMLQMIATPAMTEPRLAQLQELVPPANQTDRQFNRAVRAEFYYHVLSWLPNPKEGLKGSGGIKDMSMDDYGVVADDWFGRYDPFETAELLSALYCEWIANTSQPFDKQSEKALAALERAWTTLPENPASTTSGDPWLPFQMFVYKQRMNSTPNSAGIHLAYSIAVPNVGEVSFKTRTLRELTRSALAVRRYLLERGTLPQSWKQLIDAKVLPREPWDYYGDRPLRLDAKRGRIWSIGPDMSDDGGDIRGPFHLGAPDVGVFTPTTK